MIGERKDEEEDISENRVGSLVHQKMYSDGGQTAPGGKLHSSSPEICVGSMPKVARSSFSFFYKETRNL